MNQDMNAKELDAKKKAQERVTKRLDQGAELILRVESERQKGEPQDEKDKSAE